MGRWRHAWHACKHVKREDLTPKRRKLLDSIVAKAEAAIIVEHSYIELKVEPADARVWRNGRLWSKPRKGWTTARKTPLRIERSGFVSRVLEWKHGHGDHPVRTIRLEKKMDGKAYEKVMAPYDRQIKPLIAKGQEDFSACERSVKECKYSSHKIAQVLKPYIERMTKQGDFKRLFGVRPLLGMGSHRLRNRACESMVDSMAEQKEWQWLKRICARPPGMIAGTWGNACWAVLREKHELDTANCKHIQLTLAKLMKQVQFSKTQTALVLASIYRAAACGARGHVFSTAIAMLKGNRFKVFHLMEDLERAGLYVQERFLAFLARNKSNLIPKTAAIAEGYILWLQRTNKRQRCGDYGRYAPLFSPQMKVLWMKYFQAARCRGAVAFVLRESKSPDGPDRERACITLQVIGDSKNVNKKWRKWIKHLSKSDPYFPAKQACARAIKSIELR